MLTIGKVGASRGRLEYYEAQVARGAEDYYAGRGEAPGTWRGAGAQALRLTLGGQVDRGGFMALMRGRHPETGVVLRAMGKRSTVAGLDLTFSAPKSVSVLFAVADDETSRALLGAHERAVDAGLGYLEREACFTRRSRDGAERLRGEGFIAASYRHRMSRAGDPQLHTHVVVGNLTRADGRYTALDARALYEHKSAGGAVYRAVLRAEVRERLPWVSWRQSGRGLFEIDGVDEEVLRHFSRRRVEIEHRATELVGAATGELSRERMQGIALATRKAKSYGIDGGTWREETRARAAEHGLGRRQLASLGARRAGCAPEQESGMVERLSGPLGLTEMHNSFARRHALAEIASAFPQGTSLDQLEQTTSAYLADTSIRELADRGAEKRYTTEGLLACERQIVDGAARRASEQTGELSSEVVERVLSQWQGPLNDDQIAAVRQLSSSGLGVDAVTALAGSGKTTLLGALAACYRAAGWEVIGAAPTGRAARQLRDSAGVPAETMHALLLQLAGGSRLSSRTLLVLDEAGMAPTRLSARLLSAAEEAGAKVVAVGDPGQLGSVQAGGWLAAIADHETSPALRHAVRQTDSCERDALEALREGDPDPYLEHKHGKLTVHQHETAAIANLVQEWTAAHRHYGPDGAVMIARDNYTRTLANRAARARLKHDGALQIDGVLIGGREYAPGDRVVARRNDRRHDLDNGTLGTIVNVDEDSAAILMRTDAGDLRVVDAAYAASHLEHAYALTAHSAQGATFKWAGVIGRPEEFTREWAYTALSRARAQTTLHVIMERPAHDRERDEYAPPEPDRGLAEGRQALANAIRQTETEQLAIQQTGPTMPGHDGPPSTPGPLPPTLATPATVRPRPSRLRGVEVLRGHPRPRHGGQTTL
jgi:conjugative relaxase-like TrwC/TraI family protein